MDSTCLFLKGWTHLLGNGRLGQRKTLGDAIDNLLGAFGVLEAPDHCLADAGLRGSDLTQRVLEVVARAVRQRPARLFRQILLLMTAQHFISVHCTLYSILYEYTRTVLCTLY